MPPRAWNMKRSWTMLALVVAVAGVGLALLAGLTAGVRPASASPDRAPPLVLAQNPPTPDPNGTQTNPGGEEDDEDNSVPIPRNLLEPDSLSKSAAPDTSGAAAARSDTTRAVLPARPAQPETLRYVPQGERGVPPGPGAKGAHGAPPLVPAKPKSGGGILGLAPAVVILGLAAVHLLVVKAVK